MDLLAKILIKYVSSASCGISLYLFVLSIVRYIALGNIANILYGVVYLILGICFSIDCNTEILKEGGNYNE